MKIVTIDLETTVRNHEVGNSKASPHYDLNEVVLVGLKRDDLAVDVFVKWNHSLEDVIFGQDELVILAGHNIKFDLLWLENLCPGFLDHLSSRDDIMIWDTMIGVYLQTGQRDKFVSLDRLSELFYLPVKDSRVKDYWEDGLDTVDIPIELLTEYLIQDVENTSVVAEAQIQTFESEGMLPLAVAQMDALLATTRMEHNGMLFDEKSAEDASVFLFNELCELRAEMTFELSDAGIPVSVINPASPSQVRCALFGGSVKHEETVEVLDEEGCPVIYKTGLKKGLVKTKKERVDKDIVGLLSGHPKISGDYTTSKRDLEEILSLLEEENRGIG